MKQVWLFLGILGAGLGGYYVYDRPAELTVDYSTQVKPILNKNCISCHGGVKNKEDLVCFFKKRH